ncbi:uncharacterized protein LOC103311820 [Acyrthosiphon pisum]|uniref:THAP-type domain-containing protein n=1 Tax=Acyrthosiphon pisum TaxID=7029 RepID=A0A8R2BB23_ACYPI|nr:uncharacterized protein LOC103311820 [Acyrthosiphon pisum]|eukprot:XP_008189778.1 PREDICTED: uncharacterized protein LOC103311820 [Acyrthosiphon pisum]
MPMCSVFGCKTGSKSKLHKAVKGVRLHRFPKDEYLIKVWTQFCETTKSINIKNAHICSLHFEKQYFSKSLIQKMLSYSPTNQKKLKTDAIPTIKRTSSVNSIESNQEKKNPRKITSTCLQSPIGVITVDDVFEDGQYSNKAYTIETASKTLLHSPSGVFTVENVVEEGQSPNEVYTIKTASTSHSRVNSRVKTDLFNIKDSLSQNNADNNESVAEFNLECSKDLVEAAYTEINRYM